MKHTEIALPLKVAEKRPVDRRAVFSTLAEAYTEAYPGMACYIEETGKYYLFLLNNEGDLFASDQFPDLRPYAKITDLQNAIAELINGSPAMLDTLYELANAINNDPNFATAIFNQLNTKVDKIAGKGLSESDFTLTEKNKLAGIESGANNYSHPANHPASIITQDENNRLVSDTEKATWNAKANNAVATTSANGLMSSTDKSKLDGIAAGANNYTHPANHPASIITQDANNRFVSDTEKATWNDKYTRNETDNKLTALVESLDWKEAVNTFSDLATTYPNPEHGWTVYVKTENKKYTYNGSVWVQSSGGDVPLATNSLDGLMSKTDKSKLDGVAAGANNYTHPANHLASIITQDANNRFVSDTEKATWNAKISQENLDSQLSNVSEQVSIDILEVVSSNFAAKTHSHPIANTLVDGFMSKADKSKLNSVESGANNYTHPANHPASIITQDANNRFVSDTEKATWNAKANNAVATTSANGLMSAPDKAKLDRATGVKVSYQASAPANPQFGDIWIIP